ncbi:ribonuclease HII [Bacillus sp. JCM 19041]|uniref:ribonuclease HII n=1 Tax=Bacillus sp. JCM 19041 TaxID=1460637 RepID=UPI000A42AA67
MKSITEIRARFDEDIITAEEVENLRGDKRKGVQVLLNRYDKLLDKQHELEEMHRGMLSFENELRQAGYQMICGVDEVGRGPLAGPVTACACILPIDFQLLGLTDSKKITKAKREEFAKYIKENALAYQIASVSAQEIDKINILQATKKAMTTAINGLQKKSGFLVARCNRIGHFVTANVNYKRRCEKSIDCSKLCFS